MKISVLDHLSSKSSYVVIPFLESTYKKYGQSVFKMINNAGRKSKGNSMGGMIVLDGKYKDACDAIDSKFQNKMINIATLTVSTAMVGGASSRKHTKKNSKLLDSRWGSTRRNASLNSLGAGLLQIYLVRIGRAEAEAEARAGDVHKSLLEELRVSGHLIFNILKGNFIRSVHLYLAGMGGMGSNDLILALLEGLMLSSYKFDKYKTDKALEKKESSLVYHLENVFLISKPCGIGSSRSIAGHLHRLETVVASVFLARDLVNEPANDSRFDRFMSRLREFIKKYRDGDGNVDIDVWDKNQLEKMGMGLLLGVGKGSAPENAPRMLVIKYHPSSGKGTDPEWVLLGKGITFDTGGLDLKTEKGMRDMKSDLSGAAAVVAFLLGYAASGGRRCIYVMCPFAENSISSSAIKPSDVLKSYDGRTVEVADTDAEGRLVLADVLAYVVAKWPSARVMDLATLTGQAESISGKVFSCVLSANAEHETSELIEKSQVINESLVRLPLLEKESSKLESNIADIRNVAFKSSADIIMSSLFMRQFIKAETKWIHVDIAGPAFEADQVVKYASPEASGVGVRLLFEYFAN